MAEIVYVCKEPLTKKLCPLFSMANCADTKCKGEKCALFRFNTVPRKSWDGKKMKSELDANGNRIEDRYEWCPLSNMGEPSEA